MSSINKNQIVTIFQQLEKALCAEEIFGAFPELPAKEQKLAAIKKIYHQLALIVHPDNFNNDLDNKDLSVDAFQMLNDFYQHAQRRIEAGSYGDCSQSQEQQPGDYDFVIRTAKHSYQIRKTIAQGTIATIYGGQIQTTGEADQEVAIKVADSPEDSDLMQNEQRFLRLFHQEPSRYNKHLPVMLDQFRTTDQQIGTVLKKIDGYDLIAVQEKYTNGIPPRHLIWILRRSLSVLGFAHSKGIVHGNIDPSHLMLRPRDHNIWLIDWCFGIYKPAQTHDGFKIFNEEFSAPEVKGKKPPLPAADIYSLGKTMIYILGGNIQNDTMPDSVDIRIQKMLQFMCRKSPVQRPQDAWKLYGEIDRLRAEVFGPHKFIPFEM